MRDLEASVENEHFCLKLAAEFGLPVAKSEGVRIVDEPVICVERYDRIRIKGTRRIPLDESGARVYRVHQEDLCQATGRHPENKYQNMGGPGVEEVMRLLSGSADPRVDRERFMRALAFNFVILGIDAHAKNFSILTDHDGFRLAPLYDLISATPYDTHRFSKFAMSIGGEYRWRWIAVRHWERLAQACRYPIDLLQRHLYDTIASTPAACDAVLATCVASGLDERPLRELAVAIRKRCADLAEVYAMPAG